MKPNIAKKTPVQANRSQRKSAITSKKSIVKNTAKLPRYSLAIINNDEVETTVFKSGNSMAVRLPKAFQPKGKKMLISHNEAGEIILREKSEPENFLESLKSLSEMPNDFFAEGRHDSPPEKRDFSL